MITLKNTHAYFPKGLFLWKDVLLMTTSTAAFQTKSSKSRFLFLNTFFYIPFRILNTTLWVCLVRQWHGRWGRWPVRLCGGRGEQRGRDLRGLDANRRATWNSGCGGVEQPHVPPLPEFPRGLTASSGVLSHSSRRLAWTNESAACRRSDRRRRNTLRRSSLFYRCTKLFFWNSPHCLQKVWQFRSVNFAWKHFQTRLSVCVALHEAS